MTFYLNEPNQETSTNLSSPQNNKIVKRCDHRQKKNIIKKILIKCKELTKERNIRDLEECTMAKLLDPEQRIQNRGCTET